jgi:hypothetical protein
LPSLRRRKVRGEQETAGQHQKMPEDFCHALCPPASRRRAILR